MTSLIRLTLPVSALIFATLASQAQITSSVQMLYMSELVDKGGSFYGGDGGFLTDVTLSEASSGLSFTVSHRQAVRSSQADRKRLDYVLAYSTSVGGDSSWATDLTAKLVYHHFYNGDRFGDADEAEVKLSWNKLLPAGASTYYVIACERDRRSDEAGFYHVVGVTGSLWSPEEKSASGWQSTGLSVFAEATYRDGLGGDNVHGWSHYTIGANTGFQISEIFSASIGIAHQFSTVRAGNPDDITYAQVALRAQF